MNNEYTKIDYKKILGHKKITIISSEEALKEVVSINWSDSVLSGKSKVYVE